MAVDVKNKSCAYAAMGADPEKKRLLPNAVFAVLQVIVTSLTLFLLYRYLLSSEGIEALGVWSLVVSATSLASVSNLGLAGGAVRFVSKYLARADTLRAVQAVETATVSIAVVMGVFAVLIWPISLWLLSLVVPLEWLGMAHELLPFTLAALFLNSVGGAVYSGLDGCHRADKRSLATIGTQPLLLLVALWLVPRFGLKGLAYAQVLQYLVWVILGWLLLRQQLPALSRVPWRWSKSLFLEMWRYGLNLQLIVILGMLAEPLLKGLISHFGNLGAVGYFEMANRLVAQVRSLLVSANQVFVPYYSKLSETARDKIAAHYRSNLNVIVPLGSLLFSSLVALLPMISDVWIGNLELQFILFSVMLSGGWYVNVLAIPAYFANLGGGWVKRNLYCHVTQTAGTVVFGIAGGAYWGGAGSVVAWPLALFFGALVVVAGFHRAEGIPLSVFTGPESIKAVVLGGAVSLSGFASYLFVNEHAGFVAAALVSGIVLLIGWALFFITVPGINSLAKTLRGRSLLADV